MQSVRNVNPGTDLTLAGELGKQRKCESGSTTTFIADNLSDGTEG
jgi:hypothetical protein